MKTHNAQNERVKHAYFTYLREAKGMSEASIDQTAKALNRFETYNSIPRFQAVPPQAGGSLQAASCGPTGSTNQRTAEQGDDLLDVDRLEGFLRLASRSTRLQVADQLRRYRVLQHDHEGRSGRKGCPRTSGAHAGTDSARTALNACGHHDRPAQPRHRRIHDPDRRSRWRRRFDETQAHRSRPKPNRTGCARGPHQVLEVVYDLLLSSRRRHPGYRGGVGHVSTS